MNIAELEASLKQYNEDEIVYKEYYFAAQNADKLEAFFKNTDKAYIKARKLIIPEVHDKPCFISDEDYFIANNPVNIMISKHNRYTPEFSHRHTFMEMIFVYSGGCKQTISEEAVYLTEGDLCIIPPEVNHSISVFDDSIIINILIRKSTFNDTFLKVLSDENILSSFFFNILYSKKFSNYIIFHSGNDLYLKKLLLEIYIEQLEQKKYYEKLMDNLLMLFFAYILREHENQAELPRELNKSTQYMSSILSYIQANYKTITLEGLSKEFHFTVPYLSKIIKLNTGITFKDIIQTIKLNKATELLEKTNLKVSDISKIIGYENNTHFIRSFKKAYGTSPDKYRKAL